MATNENNPELKWTREREWGSEGLTHRATDTLANGDKLTLTVDQPRKGYWVLRGWVNGDFTVYREDTTMKGAKAQAASLHAAMVVSLAEIAVAADTPSDADEQNSPEKATSGDLTASQPASAPVVQHDPQRATRAVLWLQWRKRRSCPCPTPLHTMRCGKGAKA